MKPRLLDLCCGVGGAAVGYRRAGFCVTGVDIDPQPEYAGDEFVQGDALLYLLQHGREFDAVHASWPCQDSSTLTQGNRKREGWTDQHPDLITPGRALLDYIGRPYVIENVVGSRLRADLTLCGLMFDLRVFRHRHFELGGWTWAGPPPVHPTHRGHRVAGWRHGVKHEGDMLAIYGDGGGKGTVAEWQEGLGIHWTESRHSLREAIPPHYSHYVGTGLMHHVLGQQSMNEEAA